MLLSLIFVKLVIDLYPRKNIEMKANLHIKLKLETSVADPLGHPDPLVRGMDPDHSIVKQKF